MIRKVEKDDKDKKERPKDGDKDKGKDKGKDDKGKEKSKDTKDKGSSKASEKDKKDKEKDKDTSKSKDDRKEREKDKGKEKDKDKGKDKDKDKGKDKGKDKVKDKDKDSKSKDKSKDKGKDKVENISIDKLTEAESENCRSLLKPCKEALRGLKELAQAEGGITSAKEKAGIYLLEIGKLVRQCVKGSDGKKGKDDLLEAQLWAYVGNKANRTGQRVKAIYVHLREENLKKNAIKVHED
jgi:hypothetical protein